MRNRQWAATWLSPLALSNTALALATIIGGFGSLFLVPGPEGDGHVSWQWALVVLLSQAIFALILVIVRRSLHQPGPVAVFLALTVGGAIRGIVIEVGSESLDAGNFVATEIVARALNSAVISVIGVALIGATLTWRADFRAQYRLLRDRAILLGTAAHEGDAVEPSVLEAWTTIKHDLDMTLKEAGSHLQTGASPQDLEAAAELLTNAIDLDLRPVARAMWLETVPEEDPIRPSRLLVDTVSRWRLPLTAILGFYLVVVGLGSLIRSGFIDGGAYTLRFLIVTGVILWASTSMARAVPRRAPLIAIVTLLLLPPVILLCDHWIGSELLGLPADPSGQIVVALQTPITTVFIAMAIEAVRERSDVLAALQARIDSEVALLQQQEGRSRRDAQRLSLFVHHSVQSELSAIAMKASEAASTSDLATMDEARHEARERLEQLESLDAYSPPWVQAVQGRERIEMVVHAWMGLLEIEVELPEESACRTDQWQLATRVVEEALANSARHSGATRVEISGRCEAEVLVIRVLDDGTHSPIQSSPGLGSWWLDRVAPGEWSLERVAEGAQLTVRIR